jgi:hypothetical protein
MESRSPPRFGQSNISFFFNIAYQTGKATVYKNMYYSDGNFGLKATQLKTIRAQKNANSLKKKRSYSMSCSCAIEKF